MSNASLQKRECARFIFIQEDLLKIKQIRIIKRYHNLAHLNSLPNAERRRRRRPAPALE